MKAVDLCFRGSELRGIRDGLGLGWAEWIGVFA